jgi:hypothetical protein
MLGFVMQGALVPTPHSRHAMLVATFIAQAASLA